MQYPNFSPIGEGFHAIKGGGRLLHPCPLTDYQSHIVRIAE